MLVGEWMMMMDMFIMRRIDMRITPENITSLKEDEVFVFGSNLAGVHGAGAAKQAREQFGAVFGTGIGLQGQSYAIPTKNQFIMTMSLRRIKPFVLAFIVFATRFPEKKFMVTQIGCGHAGYTPEDIASMFEGAVDVKNIWLPESFLRILQPHQFKSS